MGKEIGRKHELSKELKGHALVIESEGFDSGHLIEMAEFLADQDVATMDEFKDRVRK